jgi:hypothetical protein
MDDSQVTNMSYDKHVVMVFEMPPRIRGPAPTLTTINEVEVIIRKATAEAETPISLAEIKRRMKAKAVRHSTVKAAVDHLRRMGCLVAAPNGSVEWGLITNPEFLHQKFVRLR